MPSKFTKQIFKNKFFRQKLKFGLVTETINSFGQPNRVIEEVELICIVHPATPDDLKILPEGERYNPAFAVYTQIPVKEGDFFHHKKMKMRIVNNSKWSDYGYYSSIAIRHEGSETGDSGGFEIPTEFSS